MVRLCFDYGHGGKDSGAIYNGRKESIDNLFVGREVAKVLKSLGFEVYETRNADINMGLKERVDFANKGKYDYFISFHRNAYKPEKANGAETFIYLSASPRAYSLGRAVQKALVICGYKDRGLKKSNFYVLRETSMPAILIEIGFIDNSLDNFIFDHNRELIIREIAKAIIYEVKTNTPE